MNILFIGSLFLVAFFVTMYRSAGAGFAYVYLPVIMLTAAVRPIPLEYLPDVTSQGGAILGIFAGLCLKGFEGYRFRWNMVDMIVVLITAETVCAAMVADHYWTGVSTFGSEMYSWILPYFVARLVFQEARTRRDLLNVLMTCVFVIAAFSLIELRLWPHSYVDLLAKLQIYDEGKNMMALRRFGFFRAMVSFAHPIHFGMACLLMIGLIVVLAKTSGVGLKNYTVRYAIVAAAIALGTSMSFTPYAAALAAIAIYWALTRVRTVRTMLTSVVVLMIFGSVMLTIGLLSTSSANSRSLGTLEGSFRNRALIVQHSVRMIPQAGMFGFGRNIPKELNLDSVDNAYLVFALRYGYPCMILWLLLPVALAHRAVKAFGLCRSHEQRLPLAVAVASVLGCMVGMYTVWAAASYTAMFLLMLAFAVSMIDIYLDKMPMAQRLQQRPVRTGFDVPPRRPQLDAVGGM
ncbi:MAG TPA: hypothetical protein VIL86_00290 [Tepidisphaeraceae bacterium]|jgi:hypothetical protein